MSAGDAAECAAGCRKVGTARRTGAPAMRQCVLWAAEKRDKVRANDAAECVCSGCIGWL